MNIRLAAIFLLAGAALWVAPAGATSIRTGSSYGNISDSATSSIGTQYLVPLTPIDPADIDLLLQISATSPNFMDPIQVTVNLSPAAFMPGTATFGIVACPGANLGNVCTPASNPTCDLSGVTVKAGTITLPGSCNVANETFYFDEALNPDNPNGVFGDISVVKPTSTPEPGSLELLALGLVSFALLSKRLLQA
jgi:hypothetical protein